MEIVVAEQEAEKQQTLFGFLAEHHFLFELFLNICFHTFGKMSIIALLEPLP